jgi:hypothetical protein
VTMIFILSICHRGTKGQALPRVNLHADTPRMFIQIGVLMESISFIWHILMETRMGKS